MCQTSCTPCLLSFSSLFLISESSKSRCTSQTSLRNGNNSSSSKPPLTMNSSRRVKRRTGTTESEQRPSSSYLTRSKSHPNRPSKSVSRGSASQDSPPINPHTPQTPQSRPAHTYGKHRNSGSSSEKDEEKLENEMEDEDEQDALQALASYIAFQQTLLRHIEIDPSFRDFSGHDQTPVLVKSRSLHSGHHAEDIMPDLDIGKGKRPEHGFWMRHL